jgi:hypothetical protein
MVPLLFREIVDCFAEVAREGWVHKRRTPNNTRQHYNAITLLIIDKPSRPSEAFQLRHTFTTRIARRAEVSARCVAVWDEVDRELSTRNFMAVLLRPFTIAGKFVFITINAHYNNPTLVVNRRAT